MPNKKGGKKFKKGKKETSFDRKLILKDPKEDQEYAKIKKVNGKGIGSNKNIALFTNKDLTRLRF